MTDICGVSAITFFTLVKATQVVEDFGLLLFRLSSSVEHISSLNHEYATGLTKLKCLIPFLHI